MSHSKPTMTAGDGSTILITRRSSPSGHPPASRDALDRGGLLAQLLKRPDLVRNRSFVIQAAVEEYQTLSVEDASLTPEAYCGRFSGMDSALQSSIFRQLEVEDFVSRNSWLQEKLQQEPWPKIGELRGSFVFAEELGRGALSRVYLCIQPDLGNRQVVVKVAGTSLGEANCLGRLRHRNIVPVFSVERDQQSGMSMLCMPFLGRSTLFDFFDQLRGSESSGWKALLAGSRIWEQPSDQSESQSDHTAELRAAATFHVVAWLGAKLADAVAHAHRGGIFHGDIKPSNVLLTRHGMPLLMDFNLSGDIARNVTANGGTLPYMPPEQVRSIALGVQPAGRYDERSDIYSLGVALYEALTGQLPFPSSDVRRPLETVASEMLNMQQRRPTPIRYLTPDVPKCLAELIHQCIEFHPDSRPQEASALAARLRAECGPWSRFIWNCRQRRRKLFAAAGMTMAVCAVSGIALAQRPPRHERLLTEAMLLRAAGNSTQAEQILQQALAERPSYADAQFEMARTALSMKSLLKANEEFHKLEQLQPSARSAAYLAYCYNVQGEHAAAIPWYLLAIERGGDVPEVLNNLCYSYECGRSVLLPSDERSASHEHLARALQQNPSLPSAQLNWVRLATQRFREDGVSMPENIPHVCRALVSSYPDNGHVHNCVAIAFAILTANDPTLKDEGLNYLNRAVELGHGPGARLLQSSDLWKPFRDDHALTPIARRSRGAGPLKAVLGLPLVVEPTSLATVK